MCDIYIVMKAMPRYPTPDAGCLSLGNVIHNGQQVNKLGGLLAACKEGIKKGQFTKSHMISVSYLPIVGLPTVRVSRTKDMRRKANTQRMSHALTSLDMPLGPITWCLIAWDPMA